MTIKVLICDPDISFALPVKRALEQSGNYVVNVFANGQAAVEMVQREPHEVAILDFNIDDMMLPDLIKALRSQQPDIFILVSPGTDEQINQLPTLDIQGSLTKPYYARQLAPVIREAVSPKKKQARKAQTPPEPLKRPEPEEVRIPEPAVQPDDTFHRLTQGIHLGETGPMQSISPPIPDAVAQTPTILEPEIPEDATIRDVVSGQAAMPSASLPPDTLPELETMSDQPKVEAQKATEPEIELVPDLAVMALAVASDDTMPLHQLSIRPFLASVEKGPGEKPSKPLPDWVKQAADEADQPTLTGSPLEVPGDTDTHPSRPISPVDIQTPLPPTVETGGEPQKSEGQPPEPSSPAATDTEPELLSSVVEVVEPPAEESASAPPPVPGVTEVSPPEAPAPTSKSVAALAVQLTQLTVESSASMTLLTRDDELVASAGDLDSRTVSNIVNMINALWRGTENRTVGNSLIRYLQLPDVKDFLLFSICTVDEMFLSMLFPSEMPVRVIRQQAEKLRRALQSIPESESSTGEGAESEAATTSPSRPTDLRPPEGLREHLRIKWTETVEAAAVAAAPARKRKEGPYAAYTFVWLPRKTGIEPEIAEMLLHWLNEIAAEHFWEIEGTEIQIPFVSVQISTPADELPTATVEALMRETVERSFNRVQWADAYYIVAPGRPITQQEISNFIDYQRETLRSTPTSQ